MVAEGGLWCFTANTFAGHLSFYKESPDNIEPGLIAKRA
jgi:hypothetical protein